MRYLLNTDQSLPQLGTAWNASNEAPQFVLIKLGLQYFQPLNGKICHGTSAAALNHLVLLIYLAKKIFMETWKTVPSFLRPWHHYLLLLQGIRPCLKGRSAYQSNWQRPPVCICAMAPRLPFKQKSQSANQRRQRPTATTTPGTHSRVRPDTAPLPVVHRRPLAGHTRKSGGHHACQRFFIPQQSPK